MCVFQEEFQEKTEIETGTAWGKAGPHNLLEQRVWPPPENEVRKSGFVGNIFPKERF